MTPDPIQGSVEAFEMRVSHVVDPAAVLLGAERPTRCSAVEACFSSRPPGLSLPELQLAEETGYFRQRKESVDGLGFGALGMSERDSRDFALFRARKSS